MRLPLYYLGHVLKFYAEGHFNTACSLIPLTPNPSPTGRGAFDLDVMISEQPVSHGNSGQRQTLTRTISRTMRSRLQP